MKVASVNIGEKKTVNWHGKKFTTGIFKKPIRSSIFLGETDVRNDVVHDRKYHGGIDKACYIYSAEHYSYWKKLYPHLEWHFGMFGENLTVEGLNEKNIHIGDIYQLGDAIVQISEPRQPCSTLNMRFDDNKMVKKFSQFGHCGAYLRVLKVGEVQAGDEFLLKEQVHTPFSMYEVYGALYKNGTTSERVAQMIAQPELARTCATDLENVWFK